MAAATDANMDQYKSTYQPAGIPKLEPETEKKLGFDRDTPGLTFSQRRRLQQREQFKKYWEMYDKESKGSIFFRIRYTLQSTLIDAPATWFRENIVDPLHDRYNMPYYQRRLDRVPEIDQCGVLDRVCIWEANEQYRFDKIVDSFIIRLLRERLYSCIGYHGRDNMWKCSNVIEDFQENELNFFIKYGEIGREADVVDAYMKQKHRLIWERRHPEFMAERKRVMEDHKKALADGKFDLRFWTRAATFNDKTRINPSENFGHAWKLDKLAIEPDQPISKDWRYYKKLYTDPEFDVRNYPPWLNEAARKAKVLEDEKAQGKTANGNEE